MPPRPLAYRITTGLFVLVLGGGGVADLLLLEPIRETLVHLGYPLYLARLLGVLKLLGAAALVAPRLPRLKEWAYAGFAFDLLGAAVSHAAVGDPPGKVLLPLALLGLGAASWALRPADRRLEPTPPA